MSENRWEILKIGKDYSINEETGTLIVKEPAVRKLLRRKDESI